MTGTPSQIECAEQIKRRVNAEFDRVAHAFEAAAARQPEPDRTDTHAIIAILQDKRVAVMANDQAGYFIKDWQELRDQVRVMIAGDADYQAIKARRGRYRANRDQHSGETAKLASELDRTAGDSHTPGDSHTQ